MSSRTLMDDPPATLHTVPGRGVGGTGGDGRVDDVAHEGEVPDLAAGAVDRQRSPGLDRVEEPGEAHVGPLPGAVDAEVPQRDRRQIPSSRRRESTGARPRAWSRRRESEDGAGRPRWSGSARRCRRSTSSTRRRAAAPRARASPSSRRWVARTLSVTYCRETVRPRHSHARLPGEVIDDIHPVEHARKVDLVEIPIDELEAGGLPGGSEVAVLDRRVVVRREGVDTAHRDTLREQSLGETGADEARTPGHQRLHPRALLEFVLSDFLADQGRTDR